MSLFTNIYLGFSKRRFLKPFNPLSKKARGNFLVSVPSQATEFLKVMPYIAALKKIGNIVMIVPQHHETICSFIKPNKFEIIFYVIPPRVLSKEHDELKKHLGKKSFQHIIELNRPANISLPYLTAAEKRICLYDRTKFPYYNIMLRDNIESLCDLFAIKKYTARRIFTFCLRGIKSTMKKHKKRRPLLFVNGTDKIDWQGDTITMGKDMSADSPEAYRLLVAADAYCGKNDVFYELAKMFSKEIIA